MAEEDVWYVNDLKIELAAGKVFRGDEPVPMQDLTFRLLMVLADAAPKVVSQQELIDKVWNGLTVSQDTITQRIHLLREALGDDVAEPRYVQTVRGRGYRLVVQTVFEPPHPAAVMAYRSRWFVTAAIATALVLGLMPGKEPAPPMPIALDPSLDANDFVAQGRRYMDGHRLEDISIAIGLFERALQKAPDDISASLSLSFALSTRATKFDTEVDDLNRAEALARSVLDRSDQNGAAWHALAYALDGQGRLNQAMAAYLRAHDLMPDDPSAASSAAYLLSVRGRLYEALKLEASTVGRGDRSRYSDIQIGLDLDLLGYPEADRWFERALTLNPTDPVITSASIYAALRRGDTETAAGLFAALPESQRATPKLRRVGADIALVAADLAGARRQLDPQAGPLSAAVAVLAGMAEPTDMPAADAGSWPDGALHQAYLAAAKGDKADAIAALENAVNLGWRDIRLMERMPFFKTLKGDEAYEAVKARIRRDLETETDLVRSDGALMQQLGVGQN